MFEKLGTPDFLIEAREKTTATRRFDFGITVLLFLLVFFVANFAQSLLLTPFLIVALLLDPAVFEKLSALEGLPSEDVLAEMTAFLDTFMKDNTTVLFGTLLSSAGAAVVAVLFCRLIEKRSLRSMALRGRYLPSSLLWGAVTGALIVLAAVVFAYCFGAVTLTGTGRGSVLSAVLIVLGFIVQAFAEELFFRGYLMISISRVRPLSVGVLISALFFALFHRTSAAISPLGLLNLFLLGLVLALFAVRCGNLFGSVALHAVYLIFEGVLLGSPVDGQAMPAAFAALSFTEGNAFLHGGAYGLGGGLAVTFALTLALAFLGMTRTRKD